MIDHSGWLEKIIAKYSNNLTTDECQALHEHVLNCNECADVMKEYEALAMNLRPLKDNGSTTQLSPRALALKNKIAQTAREKTQNKILEEAHNIIKESLWTQDLEISGGNYLGITKDELEITRIVKVMPFETKVIEQGITSNMLDKSLYEISEQSLYSHSQIAMLLSGMGLGSVLLFNLLLLPLDFILTFRFLPLVASFLPISCLLMFMVRYIMNRGEVLSPNIEVDDANLIKTINR